jgi:hypothetical protein
MNLSSAAEVTMSSFPVAVLMRAYFIIELDEPFKVLHIFWIDSSSCLKVKTDGL